MTDEDGKQRKGWPAVLSLIVAPIITGLIVAAISGQWNLAAIGLAAPASEETSEGSGQSPASSTAAAPTVPEQEPEVLAPGQVPEPPQRIDSSSESAVSSPAPLDMSITQATIEWASTKDHVAPDTVTSSYHAGFYTKVFTEQGELNHGADCFVAWTLYNGDTAVSSGNSRCAPPAGWSSSFWPKEAHLDAGAARVEASITTNWGASATAVKHFNVSPR